MTFYRMRRCIILLLSVLVSCDLFQGNKQVENKIDSDAIARSDIPTEDTSDPSYIHTGNITPAELIRFAEKLTGVPYSYASSDPAVGFDCSGFITYVFNHFGITVPRSSVDFTDVPQEILIDKAKPGDLILFTGTDSTIRSVGHMGIVISNDSALNFIHSSSGKANGVTITPLNDYYKSRFVKVIRIFPQNNRDQ